MADQPSVAFRGLHLRVKASGRLEGGRESESSAFSDLFLQ